MSEQYGQKRKREITQRLLELGLIEKGTTAPALRFLQFEVINTCNYRCPLCKTIEQDHVVRTKISLDQVKMLIDPIIDELEEISLYGQRGEPFLNRELEAIISYLKSRPVYIALSTNGSILNEERARKIVESQLDKIIYAIDGITQESYAKYRVGGNLERVLTNMRLLADTKKALGSKSPKIVTQMLLMAQNEAEVPVLQDFAKKHGADRVRLKYSRGISLNEEFAPKQDKSFYQNELKKQESVKESNDLALKCPFGLESLYVDPNGDCYTCCYGEGNSEMMVGNALVQPINKIWNESNMLWKIRESFCEQNNFLSFCEVTCTNRLCRNKNTL